jgi:hypothetical protein
VSVTDVPGGINASAGTSEGSRSSSNDAGVPLGTFTGSTPLSGEGLPLGEGVGVVDAGGVDAAPVGVLTGSPLHAAASTNARAHIARRMPGSVSAPT